MKRFENKTVLITGSTQGIGAASALRFAEEGANVIINGRKNDERVATLLDQMEKLNAKATFLQADISDHKKMIELIDSSVAAFDGLDILVNNAGIEINNDFWKVTEEEYDAVINTNLKAVFFGMQKFVQHRMSVKKPGVIVNMSSVHEEISFPHFAAYCASKGALKMLTRNLATELAPYNIRINNVAPGAIATPINKKLTDNPELLNKVLQNIPLNRMGKPEEVAGVIAFLASDDAAYVTGSTYFIDGGLTYHYTEQ